MVWFIENFTLFTFCDRYCTFLYILYIPYIFVHSVHVRKFSHIFTRTVHSNVRIFSTNSIKRVFFQKIIKNFIKPKKRRKTWKNYRKMCRFSTFRKKIANSCPRVKTRFLQIIKKSNVIFVDKWSSTSSLSLFGHSLCFCQLQLVWHLLFHMYKVRVSRKLYIFAVCTFCTFWTVLVRFVFCAFRT